MIKHTGVSRLLDQKRSTFHAVGTPSCLTCVDAGCQATLVKRLQEEPPHSAAWPTTEDPSNDIIKTKEGHSSLRGQVG